MKSNRPASTVVHVLDERSRRDRCQASRSKNTRQPANSSRGRTAGRARRRCRANRPAAAGRSPMVGLGHVQVEAGVPASRGRSSTASSSAMSSRCPGPSRRAPRRRLPRRRNGTGHGATNLNHETVDVLLELPSQPGLPDAGGHRRRRPAARGLAVGSRRGQLLDQPSSSVPAEHPEPRATSIRCLPAGARTRCGQPAAAGLVPTFPWRTRARRPGLETRSTPRWREEADRRPDRSCRRRPTACTRAAVFTASPATMPSTDHAPSVTATSAVDYRPGRRPVAPISRSPRLGDPGHDERGPDGTLGVTLLGRPASPTPP